jgi:hypothetical protein
MKNCIYNETQSFLKSKTILIPLVLLLFFIYGFYHQFILKIPFGNHPMSYSGFLLFFSGYMLFLIFFISISLDTKIFEDGISIRFFPIQLKPIYFNWDDISKVEIVTYNPILEYGGWGYRGFNFSRKRALNISGNKGIKITFNDGKSLLIGTQREDEVQKILSTIEKINAKYSSVI